MAKERSSSLDYAVYLLIRILVCILQSLSYEAGQSFARLLAWLAYRIDRRHRGVALDNLRQAFPGRYSDQELDELVKEVYGHFCNIVIEMIHLPRKLRVHNYRRYLRVGRGKEVVAGLVSGRPILIVTGHYGNWEMAGYALAMLGFKTYAVARPLDNPYLDQFLRKFRERTGQKLLAKRGELDRMQDILAEGGVICTLADQDAGPKGMFVPFFGRPASTHKAIALLALEHRPIIFVAGARKVGEPMRYVIEAADIIPPEEYADRPDALRYLTERYSAALEKLVRMDIRQYFWLHRRWKNQPRKKRE